jgi:hypothetical protein
VRLVRPALPMSALVVGGLLPDLIDKPLYYGLVFATGRRGVELGLVSGTRTFGHTGLLLIAVAALAVARRSLFLRAMAWGVLSHLVLDVAGDLYGLAFGPREGPSILSALFFPLLGPHFPVSPFHSVREHLLSVRNFYVLGGELAGATLLAASLFRRWRERSSGSTAPARR